MKVRDFATIRADRVGRRKGGVAIFLHDSFTTDAKDIFSNGYCESVSVHNSANDFTIIGLYRPPQTPLQHFRECLYGINFSIVHTIFLSIPWIHIGYPRLMGVSLLDLLFDLLNWVG